MSIPGAAIPIKAPASADAEFYPGPPEPQSLADAGIAEALVEELLLKILYFRGEMYGRDLSEAIGLKFSVIQDVLDNLKLRHLVQVKRSLGLGNVGAVLALTDAGRERAREALDSNRYSGPAPVPLTQYQEVVRRQRPKPGWLTRRSLERALSGMVITERLLSQVGPAVSSAASLLLYGKPGDGKTFLIESLNNIEAHPVYVPHAIECQGCIVQVFDPVYHQPVRQEEQSVLEAVGDEASHDRRWVKCRRPFIISGGELTTDMLDLRYNEVSKVYEAPLQLKANNGMYMIDDFGRQLAAPTEVLNRWIVPMERRVDYLSFVSGGKMTVPFETFLVFSTNLNPADLGDEAFLRRIQYKMLLRGPAKNEFLAIFENVCREQNIPCMPGTADQFVERRYVKGGKQMRRCHPRDLLTHALSLIQFENLPRELTGDLLDRAFASCFLEEEDSGNQQGAVIVRPSMRPCAEVYSERIAEVRTHFGRLAFVASFLDRTTGAYRDPQIEPDYKPQEISQTLSGFHTRVFREWLRLNLEQQRHDLVQYLSTPEGRAAFLSFNHRELAELLAPAQARDEERDLFCSDLGGLIVLLSQRQREEPVQRPVLMERTA